MHLGIRDGGLIELAEDGAQGGGGAWGKSEGVCGMGCC